MDPMQLLQGYFKQPWQTYQQALPQHMAQRRHEDSLAQQKERDEMQRARDEERKRQWEEGKKKRETELKIQQQQVDLFERKNKAMDDMIEAQKAKAELQGAAHYDTRFTGTQILGNENLQIPEHAMPSPFKPFQDLQAEQQAAKPQYDMTMGIGRMLGIKGFEEPKKESYVGKLSGLGTFDTRTGKTITPIPKATKTPPLRSGSLTPGGASKYYNMTPEGPADTGLFAPSSAGKTMSPEKRHDKIISLKEKVSKTIKARADFQKTGKVLDDGISAMLASFKINVTTGGEIPQHEKDNVMNRFNYMITVYKDEIMRHSDALGIEVNSPQMIPKPNATGGGVNDVKNSIYKYLKR